MSKKERQALFSASVGVLVMTATAFLAIPKYGIEGAAFAYISGLLTVQILMLGCVGYLIGVNPTLLGIFKFSRSDNSFNDRIQKDDYK